MNVLVFICMAIRNWKVRSRRRDFKRWQRKSGYRDYRLWESIFYGDNL